MSDPAIVVITEGSDRNLFYSHFGREVLPKQVQAAMCRGKERLKDFQYLSRIIFCEMVSGDPMGTSGYGIGGNVSEPGIVLDITTQTVTMNKKIYSFDEFMLLKALPSLGVRESKKKKTIFEFIEESDSIEIDNGFVRYFNYFEGEELVANLADSDMNEIHNSFTFEDLKLATYIGEGSWDIAGCEVTFYTLEKVT